MYEQVIRQSIFSELISSEEKIQNVLDIDEIIAETEEIFNFIKSKI